MPIDEHQILYGFNTTAYQTYMGKVSVYIMLTNGTVSSHGPYGKHAENFIIYSPGVVLGFYGFSAYYPPVDVTVLCSLGVYTTG